MHSLKSTDTESVAGEKPIKVVYKHQKQPINARLDNTQNSDSKQSRYKSDCHYLNRKIDSAEEASKTLRQVYEQINY